MMFFIRKIFAILISFFLFFGGQAPAGYESPADESSKLTAVILSDVHIEGNNSARWNRFGKTLEGVWADGNVPGVIAFCGDQTMNGQKVEWFDFYGLLNRYNKGSETVMAFGNHEFGNTGDNAEYDKLAKRAIEYYNGYAGGSADNVYYSKTVDGYKFIVLGSEMNLEDTVQHISDTQIQWLKGELADCKSKGIPAIVLNHNLIYGKNGSRSYWDFNLTDNDEALRQALETSGVTTVYFCGHSHFGVNEGTFNTEGNVTYVNLPSAGNTENYGADGLAAQYGNGCQMDVYSDRIVLRMRNFAFGEYIDGYDNYVITL